MSRCAPVDFPITQAFGVPNSMYRLGYHPGTDYGAPSGTQAVAGADGTVHLLGDLKDGYGCQVKLTLDAGGVLVYCHLDEATPLLVPDGSHVVAGTPIVVTDNSGLSTGPHLHIEWRPDDNINNPQNFEDWLQGGNDMTKEQAQELSLYLRLLDFESVDQATTHSEDDVNHMLADPGYAGALAKQIYQGGNWQAANAKVVDYPNLQAKLAAASAPASAPPAPSTPPAPTVQPVDQPTKDAAPSSEGGWWTRLLGMLINILKRLGAGRI